MVKCVKCRHRGGTAGKLVQRAAHSRYQRTKPAPPSLSTRGARLPQKQVPGVASLSLPTLTFDLIPCRAPSPPTETPPRTSAHQRSGCREAWTQASGCDNRHFASSAPQRIPAAHPGSNRTRDSRSIAARPQQALGYARDCSATPHSANVTRTWFRSAAFLRQWFRYRPAPRRRASRTAWLEAVGQSGPDLHS